MSFLSKILSALANATESATSSDDAEPRQVSEFEKTVNDVAVHRRIARVSYPGNGEVSVLFRSRSGRQTWGARFLFDEQTGDFKCEAAYPDSTELHAFGREVRDRIRSR